MPEASAEVKVRVGDTDMFGIVYFANYFRFFEMGLDALMTSLKPGADVRKELWEKGYFTPIVEAYCKYRAPARYGDVLKVKVKVDEVGEDYIRYAFSIERESDGVTCAEGYVRSVVIRRDCWKRAKVPELLRQLLAGE